MAATGFVTHLNRIALSLAAVAFFVLGLFWWRDRTRGYEAPRWPGASFVVIAAPAPVTPAERWIVAVNPGCARCVARLADLRRQSAAWTADVALGVLLVDVPRRPDSVVARGGLDAGVWWDSLGSWRSRWGHRVYGETMVFGRDGALARVLAPTGEPAPAAR